MLVSARVLRGDRPPRPVSNDGIAMPAHLWNAVAECWKEKAAERPTTKRLAQMLDPRMKVFNGWGRIEGFLEEVIDDVELLEKTLLSEDDSQIAIDTVWEVCCFDHPPAIVCMD